MKVEFIESYIRVGNDYQWNDNHGEIVRCKDCVHWRATETHSTMCDKYEPDAFCSHGERKEDE